MLILLPLKKLIPKTETVVMSVNSPAMMKMLLGGRSSIGIKLSRFVLPKTKKYRILL